MTNKADLLAVGWQGRPCYVVGGGPSLLHFDFGRLDGRLSVGVNRAFEFFTPSVLLALDARFFKWVRDGKYGPGAAAALERYPGPRVGVRISAAHAPGVFEVRSLGPAGPVVDIDQGLYHGNNSGYSALALALALGAGPVFLLGVDLRYWRDGEAERTHHHGGHPERTPESDLLKKCLPHFARLAAGPHGHLVRIVETRVPFPRFSRLHGLFDSVTEEEAFDAC